jgi:hypothetical protein
VKKSTATSAAPNTEPGLKVVAEVLSTQVFRLDDDGRWWRLHCHADPLIRYRPGDETFVLRSHSLVLSVCQNVVRVDGSA